MTKAKPAARKPATTTAAPDAANKTAPQAAKVETPAEAQKPGSATGAAAAKNEPDTTSQGVADLTGQSTAGTKPTANPETGTAATGSGAPDPATHQQDLNAGGWSGDEEAIRQEEYNRGYSDGFSEALDGATAPGTGGPSQDPDAPDFDYAARSTGGMEDYEKAAIVTLALMTPENQRKGGLPTMVKRLAGYFNGLNPEDRRYAISFAAEIGRTKPINLANGKFQRTIDEAIGILNGQDQARDPDDTAQSAAAAAHRLAEAFPQDDESEKEEDQLDPDVDLDDENSAESAAARLSQL